MRGEQIMMPQDVKYHTCPRCKKQAIILVDVEDNTIFYRDDMANIQYKCVNCGIIFSIDKNGKIVLIKLKP